MCVHSRNTLSRPLRQDIKRICAVSSKFDAGSGVLRGRLVCCPPQPPRLPFAGRPVERAPPALPSDPPFELSFGRLEVLCHSPRCRQLFGSRPVVSSHRLAGRSEEHTSELQSLMRISYAVFCLKTKKTTV